MVEFCCHTLSVVNVSIKEEISLNLLCGNKLTISTLIWSLVRIMQNSSVYHVHELYIFNLSHFSLFEQQPWCGYMIIEI